MAVNDYFTRTLLLKADDVHLYLQFLHDTAAVSSAVADPHRPDRVRVTVLFNKATADKFEQRFRVKITRQTDVIHSTGGD